MNIQELPPIDAIIELDNKAELIDEEKIQKAFPGFERIEPTINKEGDKEILNSSSDSVPDYEDVSEFNSISKGDEYRIFECAEDNDYRTFNFFARKYSKIMRKVLSIKDYRNRNLLSNSAYRGSIQVMELLLEAHRKENIPINLLDMNKDDAIYLACIRGYQEIPKETYKSKDENGKDSVTSKRFQCVRMLLNYRNSKGVQELFINKKSLRKGLNSPLHWAIYWADLELAKLTYDCYPDQLFWINSDSYIPFDMCNQAKDQLFEYKAKIIVFFLLDKIYSYLMKAKKKEESLSEQRSELLINKSQDNNRESDIPDKEQELMKSHNRRRSVINSIFEDLEDLVDTLDGEGEAKIMLDRLVQESKNAERPDLSEIYDNSRIYIIGHDENNIKKNYGHACHNAQLVLRWYAYFNKAEQMFYLMKNLNVSPFRQSSNGRSAIHILCIENRPELLEILNSADYYLIGDGVKVDLSKALNTTSGYGVNTPAHHCLIWGNWRCLDIIIKRNVDLTVNNFRGKSSLDLIRDINLKYFKVLKSFYETKWIEDCLSADKINSIECSDKKLNRFNSAFTYCIVTQADSHNPRETTVYRQLKHIQENWAAKGNFKIQVLEGVYANDKSSKNRVYDKTFENDVKKRVFTYYISYKSR